MVNFNPTKDIPDLSGKVILVTGGNTGLGKESIKQLVKHNPAKIYLAARTPSKAEEAISDIKKLTPSANIEFLQLDLGSLKSVKEAAESFKKSSDRLDILMNNAGIMAVPEGLTQDGYEIQFGTNHMGHFLFTKELLPLLQKTAEEPDSDVRIVTLASMGFKWAPQGGVIFPTLKTQMDDVMTWRRYGQSKTANILHAAELARRYPAIKTMSLHPGGVATNLDHGFRKSHPWFAKTVMWLTPLLTVSVEKGALNQLWAATTPREKVEDGKYYVPVGVKDKEGGYAENKELARELWEWSEKELAEKGY